MQCSTQCHAHFNPKQTVPFSRKCWLRIMFEELAVEDLQLCTVLNYYYQNNNNRKTDAPYACRIDDGPWNVTYNHSCAYNRLSVTHTSWMAASHATSNIKRTTIIHCSAWSRRGYIWPHPLYSARHCQVLYHQCHPDDRLLNMNNKVNISGYPNASSFR